MCTQRTVSKVLQRRRHPDLSALLVFQHSHAKTRTALTTWTTPLAPHAIATATMADNELLDNLQGLYHSLQSVFEREDGAVTSRRYVQLLMSCFVNSCYQSEPINHGTVRAEKGLCSPKYELKNATAAPLS